MSLPYDETNLRTTIVPNTGPAFIIPPETGQPPPYPAPIQDPTRIGVEYQESEGSPRTHWRNNGSEVVRTLQCAWQAPGGCVDATKDLLGFPRVLAGPNGGRYISRYLPNAFPLASAGDPWNYSRLYLYCTSIRNTRGLIPHPTSNKDQWGIHQYTMVEIEAVWETLEYDLLSDTDMAAGGFIDEIYGLPDESTLTRFVIRRPQPSSSLTTLPPGTLVYAFDGSKMEGNPARSQLKADLEIKWLNIPTAAVPFRFINQNIADTVQGFPYTPPIEYLLGRVNLTDFANCKKGTLLFSSVTMSPVQSPIGDRLWDLGYRFNYFPAQSTPKYMNGGPSDYVYGHNMILRPDATPPAPATTKVIGYDEVVVKPATGAPVSNAILTFPVDGQNPYNYGDFLTLFRVPYLAIDNP